MRAREFVDVYDYRGLKLKLWARDDRVIVDAFDAAGKKKLGTVVFDVIEGRNEIEAQDLHVEQRYRNQGIARAMYDFAKAHGYIIHRSPDQTDDGAAFWDKNRPGQTVWEQSTGTGPYIIYATGPRTQGINDVDLVFKDIRTGRIVAHVVGNNNSLSEFAPPEGGGNGGDLPKRPATYEIRMGNAAKPTYVAFGDPQQDSKHQVYKLGPAQSRAPQYYGQGLTLVSELDWWSFLEKMIGEIMWEDDAIEAGYVDRLNNGDLVFVNQQGVAEAFDQPYPIKWEKSDFGDHDALATLSDGTPFTIMFNGEPKNNWVVDFHRNNSQDVTGEGDAQRVFATVLAAIRQFIIKKKPNGLTFHSIKEADPKGTRTRLYDRLVQRYAQSLGYQLNRVQQPGQVIYKLTRIQNVKEDVSQTTLNQLYDEQIKNRQGVAEGKMDELEMDLEDPEITDRQFEKIYGMTRKEAREQFSQTDMWAFPEIRDPNRPLHEQGVSEVSLIEFAPPGSDGDGEDERSRRIRKLLEIAIKVAKEKNVDKLSMVHAMNMIAGDDFFSVAVDGLLPDITDHEYMFVLQTAYKTVKQGVAEGLNEFTASGRGDSGDYLRALASAWYNDTFNTGSLQRGIKSQEDVERILARGIVCADGKTRKYNIDYNGNFDGVVIFSDDYYEHSDAGGKLDNRTGRPWGPYDFIEFKGQELDESITEGTVTESTNTNILVVDVQPTYDGYAGAVVEGVAQMLNQSRGSIYVLYNAEGQTQDDYIDVINYLIDQGGMKEQVADRINYFSKEYGFFRAWMDQGVPDSIIIKTVRAMVQRRVNDSRMLDINTVLTPQEQKLFQSKMRYSGWEDEGIYMPDFMPISILKQISPFYMVGGGRRECLREIELLCNAFNIRYRRIDQLIYG